MKKRSLALVLLGVLLLTLSSVQVTGAARPLALYSYTESFEQSFGGWITDHYLQCEPGCGNLVWSITRSTDRAYQGIYSLKGYLDGTHDDGTIWVERPFYLTTLPSGTRVVTLTFQFWSPVKTSVNTWPVVAFLNQYDPETELDFTIVGQTDQVAGWQQYSLTRTMYINTTQPLWAAFGFGATWEVARTYYMDYVTLTIN